MRKQRNIGIVRKRVLRGAVYLVVAAFVLTGAVRPAHAQMAVVDAGDIAQTTISAVQNTATAISTAATWLQTEFMGAQAATDTAVNSAGQAVQTQANANIADTAATNARQNVTVQTAQNLAVAYTAPSNYSYCNVAQSAATADTNEVDTAATAQALIQGNQRRMADPVVNAQEIKNECTLGFAPASDPHDPEYSAWAGLGCSSSSSGHVRQDRNIAAVTGPLEYLVDPAFQLPQANGVYTPMTAVSGSQYYPFVAAVTFCQHIPTAQPLPPQAVSGKATIDLLKIIQYATTESAGSGASSACFSALAKRMQFGSGGAFPNRHAEQVAQCEVDHGAFLLDDAKYTDCQNNGRSELQAEHDRAFKNEMGIYQTNYLATMEYGTSQIIRSNNEIEEGRFQQQLRDENYVLGALLRQTPVPGTGATSQPTQ